MASGKLTLAVGFFIFFLLINIVMLGRGVLMGEVTSTEDIWEQVSPMNSLTNYNDWLKVSYEQSQIHEANLQSSEINDLTGMELATYMNEQEMGLRNANFGIVISILAIFVFIAFIATLLYFPMPNGYQWFGLGLLISLGITHFLFNGLYGVLYVLNGVI